MPLKAYGVLIARAVDTRREGSADTPHYQIHLTEDQGTHYRAAVNVKSQEKPSELLYLVVDDLQHPVMAHLEGLRSRDQRRSPRSCGSSWASAGRGATGSAGSLTGDD